MPERPFLWPLRGQMPLSQSRLPRRRLELCRRRLLPAGIECHPPDQAARTTPTVLTTVGSQAPHWGRPEPKQPELSSQDFLSGSKPRLAASLLSASCQQFLASNLPDFTSLLSPLSFTSGGASLGSPRALLV